MMDTVEMQYRRVGMRCRRGAMMDTVEMRYSRRFLDSVSPITEKRGTQVTLGNPNESYKNK